MCVFVKKIISTVTEFFYTTIKQFNIIITTSEFIIELYSSQM